MTEFMPTWKSKSLIRKKKANRALIVFYFMLACEFHIKWKLSDHLSYSEDLDIF